MRKIFLTFSMVILSICVWAQAKNVRQAQNALSKGDYAEANSLIEPALQDSKTGKDGKTWYVYGEINQAHALESDAPADAMEKAIEGFQKAIELEKEGSDTRVMAEQKIQEIWAQVINQGAEFYQNEDFADALTQFEYAQLAMPEDTTGYIYAGISAQQAGDLQVAAQNYRFLIDSLNYKNEDFYNSIIYIYTQPEHEDLDLAIEYLEKAQEDFPDNADFLKTHINLLIAQERMDEAVEKMDKALAQDPNDPILHYNQGVIYEQLGQEQKAVESYQKAIEQDPNYFDAIFNLAAHHYNQAAEVLKEVGNMDLKEYQTKGKELEAQAQPHFEAALPYLEKAYELKPEDERVINTLSTTYTRLGMEEKANELKN